MTSVYEKTETNTHINPDGTIEVDETKMPRTIMKDVEPDYIKIYTKMWCEFNSIPEKYHTLFLSLAMRMSYCSKSDLKNSQLVYTGEPWQSEILRECGWKTRDPLAKGLKTLRECGAIKKVARGVYQINPQYAGKGPWRYNPKLDRGGIEDLIATFNFKDKTVDTQIFYRDHGSNTEIDETSGEAFDTTPDDNLAVTMTKITPKKKGRNPKINISTTGTARKVIHNLLYRLRERQR